jgi:hypothetical protein
MSVLIEMITIFEIFLSVRFKIIDYSPYPGNFNLTYWLSAGVKERSFDI